MKSSAALRMRFARVLLLALCLAAAACASAPPPTERLTTSEAAIRGALEVEANTVPRAALHVKLAQEQVEKAKRYMQAEEYDRAELALRRAQADAELAIALARENDITIKAKAARARVEKLKASKPL